MATRAEWARRVRRWESSGLSAAAFAAREGVVVKSLLWWPWKLRSKPAAAALEPRFVPVHVVDSAARPRSTTAAIEIALPDGRVVRVCPGFDPATLEQVLAIATRARGSLRGH